MTFSIISKIGGYFGFNQTPKTSNLSEDDFVIVNPSLEKKYSVRKADEFHPLMQHPEILMRAIENEGPLALAQFAKINRACYHYANKNEHWYQVFKILHPNTGAEFKSDADYKKLVKLEYLYLKAQARLIRTKIDILYQYGNLDHSEYYGIDCELYGVITKREPPSFKEYETLKSCAKATQEIASCNPQLHETDIKNKQNLNKGRENRNNHLLQIEDAMKNELNVQY